MSPQQPEGPWGSYGTPGPAFAPFASALVNNDGTFLWSSGNLSMLKGSAGNYILQPLDAKGNPLHYPSKALLPIPIVTGGAPYKAIPTFGLGPSSDGIQVLVYDATNTLVDQEFYFALSVNSGFFTP